MASVWGGLVTYFLNNCTVVEDLGKGRQRASISIKPVAFWKAAVGGGLVQTAIDQTVRASKTGDLPFEVVDGPFRLRLPDRLAKDKPCMATEVDGFGTTWRPVDVSDVPGKSVLDGVGNVIGREWAGAWAGCTLRYVNYGFKVKADVDLGKGHPASISFAQAAPEASVATKVATLTARTAGGFALSDDKGKSLLTSRAGYLYKTGDIDSPSVPVETVLVVEKGITYLRYILPKPPDGQVDWSGWTLDPTWESQPDAAAGIDNFMRSDNGSTNYGTDTTLRMGKVSTITARTLLQFADPAITGVTSSTLTLTVSSEAADVTSYFQVHRLKVAWVEAQSTWNIRSTGNNWTTAGAFDAADCEQAYISISAGVSATAPAGTQVPFTLPVLWADTDLGYGWLIRGQAENSDYFLMASSDHATASYRPKLTVVYESGTNVTLYAVAAVATANVGGNAELLPGYLLKAKVAGGTASVSSSTFGAGATLSAAAAAATATAPEAPLRAHAVLLAAVGQAIASSANAAFKASSKLVAVTCEATALARNAILRTGSRAIQNSRFLALRLFRSLR